MENKIGYGDTVVVVDEESGAKKGDIGKVVEFGDTGTRRVCVRFRDSSLSWQRAEDLVAI